MVRGRLLVAAICLSALSCTFIFTAADENGGSSTPDAAPAPVADVCLGVQRIYNRGESVEGSRFEYLDYDQGTITFWAKALTTPIEGNVHLVDLGNILVSTNAEGAVRVTIPRFDGAITYTSPDTVNWEQEGEGIFIALRWDSRNPVSGNQGTDSHVIVRVGEKRSSGGVPESFDALPRNNVDMKVGDANGVFHVDQLVIYGRPLFVADSVTGEDELRVMSERKTDAAQLVRGGVDVSFATSSPIHDTCDDFEALAWSMPTKSLVPGQLRSADVTDFSWDFFPGAVATDQLVFASAIAVQGERTEPAPTTYGSSFTVTLTANSSYSVYALTHGEGGIAVPRLRIIVQTTDGDGNVLVDMADKDGTLAQPTSMFTTFQMPDDLAKIRVELSDSLNSADARAIFHTLVIRENYFANPSFEKPGTDGVVAEAWEMRAEDGVGVRGQRADGETNSGFFSVCFDGVGMRSDVAQLPDVGLLSNEEFYAAGASFYRGPTADAVTPGVTTGNSGFWGTGAPHEAQKRVSAKSPSTGNWAATGIVAYRLRGSEFDAGNDYIYFGGLGGQPEDILDLCVDDAYFYPVTKLEGTF